MSGLREDGEPEATPTPWWEEPPTDDTQAHIRALWQEVESVHAVSVHRASLWQAQTQTESFPQSDGPKNPDITSEEEIVLSARYESVLPPYKSVIESDKTDFPNKNPDVGYKLHLNVPTASVRFVAEYLKRERYCHKYLTGGEVEDGKIFTIYVGSQQLTAQLAQKLSTDLASHLCRPVERSGRNVEVEFAPNVVGRFKGDADFTPYPVGGLRGIPLVRSIQNRAWRIPQEEQRDLLESTFNISYNALAVKYGTYFTG